MKKKTKTGIFVLVTILNSFAGYAQKNSVSFSSFISTFNAEYQQLNIPTLEYDYRSYFKAIPGLSNLDSQEIFFRKVQADLSTWNEHFLRGRDKLHYDQLIYECANNLERIALEKEWAKSGRVIPVGGLHNLVDNRRWYGLFSKRFTSIDMSPEDIYSLGLSETKMVQRKIADIRNRLDFPDSVAFYQHLKSDKFLLTDKNEILRRYGVIDNIVRRNLNKFIDVRYIPPVSVMEWPNATKFTPPGMYVNREYNAYGRDVFQYNFYGGTHNIRAMDWLYMHEAIPGHHLQATEWSRESRDDSILRQLFMYPGNFEGWACYVEYFGKDLGLYQNPYSELGKWEWDLVRSVRVVIDIGIHYYGWDYNKSLDFWKANISGQDEIAEREITRITNWPGQVLSYKIGANKIMEIKKGYKQQHPKDYDLRKFHDLYIRFGMAPLEIIEKHILQ